MGKKSRTDAAQGLRENLAGRMASREAESRHIQQTKLLAEIARQSKSTAKELRAVGKAIAEITALLAPMAELLNAPSGAETARHARGRLPTVPEWVPNPRIATVPDTVLGVMVHHKQPEYNWTLGTVEYVEEEGFTVVAGAEEVEAHFEWMREEMDLAYRTMSPYDAGSLYGDLNQSWVREILKKRRERLHRNMFDDMTDAPPRTTDIPQGVTIEMLRNNPVFAADLANSRGVDLADWLATDGKPSSEQIAGDQG